MSEITNLTVAVHWNKGWKTYTVTGTRHAGNLIRKFAGYRGFLSARLNDPLERPDGSTVDNVIHIFPDDVTHDPAGKFGALFDRNNAHYDLRVRPVRRPRRTEPVPVEEPPAEEPEWEEPDWHETPGGWFEK